MKLRKRHMPLVALFGVSLAVIPAMASSSSAAPSKISLQVNENCVQADWPCWTAETSGVYPQPASRITIAAGGEIEFVDHASTEAAVNWIGAAPACPTVPTTAKSNWEGTCKFEQPGTYTFESSTMFDVSGVANYTKYEVVVEAASTGTTTTGMGPGTTTTGTTPSGGGSGGGQQPAGPVDSLSGSAVRLSSSQRGGSVQGSVQVAQSGSKLTVEALSGAAQLAGAHRSQVRVGRLVRSSLPAGKTSFSVSLDARARHALQKRRRLALTVRLSLIAPSGTASTRTVSMVLHRP
jgi:plastocyanin